MLTRSQFSKPYEELNTERWYNLSNLTSCEYAPIILIDELHTTGKLPEGSCKKCLWCARGVMSVNALRQRHRESCESVCLGCCGLGFYYDSFYLDQDVMLPVGVYPNDQP